QEVVVRHVGQMLTERPHFLLRPRPKAIHILRHLLGRADDVVLVAVVHVAEERRGGRRRLRLLSLLSEGRRGKRGSEQRDHEKSVHHARIINSQLPTPNLQKTLLGSWLLVVGS